MRPSRAIAIASLSALFLSLSAGSTTASQTTSPLPGGVVRMPGLQAAASIVRDSNGLAHIHAGNRHDLYFLQGWVHAQDRLFQMDVSRRTTDGTLAELLGTSALPQDVQLRTIGLHRAAERSWQAYSVDTRVALDAYTDGVNAFVAANPLPREYTALNLTSFRAWRPQDTVGIGKLIAFGLSFDLDIDLTLSYLRYVGTGQALGFNGDALFFDDLNQTRPFSPASTVPDATTAATATAARERAHPSAAMAQDNKLQRLMDARPLIEAYRDAISGIPLLAKALDRSEHAQGSNEWVIAGTHTTSGQPILANDPHLAIDQPSTFYPIHLGAGGLNVAGEGFAGTPGVIIGQNERIAWGATTNPMDVTDTYLEQLRPDPASPSGLATVYRGALEPIIPIPETFRANVGGALVTIPPSQGVPAATLIVPRRDNGPIVQLDQAAGTALSVQYTGFSATRELETFLRWDEADNLADFREGLRLFDFGSQNWAYADRRGNVAYFTSGELPLREDLEAGTVAGLPPFMIRNGTGGNEWLPQQTSQPDQAVPHAVLPAAEMPQTVNPANGWFVNANNDPAGTALDGDPLNQLRPTGGIYYLSPGYDGLRSGRITEMVRAAIAGGNRVERADVERMQADTVFIDAEFFVPQITAAYQAALGSNEPALQALAADPAVAEAVARLATWDFSAPTGIPQGYDAADDNGQLSDPTDTEIANSVAASIYSVWRSRFMDATIGRTLTPLGLGRPRTESELVALKRLLSGGTQSSGLDFFAVPGISDPTVRQQVILLTAVRSALARLASADFSPAFGGSTNQNDYRWGRLHRIVLDSPLGAFSVPPGFGQFPAPLPGLRGIPVDGGYGTVDSASHDARANSVNAFMFGSGPARRYVGETNRFRIEGESALPGGTSADPDSGHYLDLLGPYLTDDYYRVRTSPSDYLPGADSRTVYVPG
jgi:penicillin G amidase